MRRACRPLLIHLCRHARGRVGIVLDWQDFSDLADVPRPCWRGVYPNGLADVNHFPRRGVGLFDRAAEWSGGLLHDEVKTIAGEGAVALYQVSQLKDGAVRMGGGAGPRTLNDKVVRPIATPSSPTGGLETLWRAIWQCGHQGLCR